ncbi:FecR family protein [Chitinophaga nivalis]|uniref:DUF4974 domain-containing protein n=1 Tax=Chitinophaga nivalis TaxID=2991709 RepID=A0ABT3IGW1_9BACT|nr:FecR domain-containing protein [Chitinophaga nivalis]MCW3467101.1 DUF4974 domain-containing protein [Chitinophaga nivalis]MCW3483208.1 DUF4974 domain-containing protein [Chitinophaga nivalis]
MDLRDYQPEDFVCDESFQHYCTGANLADVLRWEQWLRENPQQEANVAAARRLIQILSAEQGNRLEQLQQLREGIQQGIRLQQDIAQQPEIELPPVRRERQLLSRYAAVAVLMLLVVTGRYFYLRQPIPDKMMQPRQTTTTYAAGNQSRKTVILPDGTVITLRRNSTLTLSPEYHIGNRDVTLEGEAFFDVTHDEKKLFRVHTSQALITVMGTVFNVAAWAGNGKTETALFRGSVSVIPAGRPAEKIILQPNQKLVIAADTNPAQSTRSFRVVPLAADPANHKAREIAWVRNRLEIENESLEEIAGKLQQWYGISVVFTDDTVKQYRYSGTFESETIVKALEALQLSYPFNFKMTGEQVIISK